MSTPPPGPWPGPAVPTGPGAPLASVASTTDGTDPRPPDLTTHPHGPAGHPDGPYSGSTPPAPRMDQRTWAMVLAGVAAVVLLAVVSLLPMPYALMRPGPVVDVLSAPDGTPLITVQDRETYETSGSLDLLTVRVEGGPGTRVSVWQVVRGWLDPAVAVRPTEELFPPAVSQEDVDQQNAQEMVTSQETATVAAMDELGIQVPTTLTVAGFTDGSGAEGVLRDGDVVTSVQGAPVVDLPELRDLLQEVEPGGDVTIGYTRGGAPAEATFPTSEADGRTVMGVFIDPTYELPFEVSIRIEDIGGPSAGMIFALGIVDKLTPGEMTGGERIAGTGTMDSDGTVGPIGGIQQKLVGADDAGADWFLAPAANCDEVVGHVPDGLRVVRVETLEDARAAVEAIGSKDRTAVADLPTCTG
ncbi:PDZ domain-containing protein [Angustibacter speluncae]